MKDHLFGKIVCIERSLSVLNNDQNFKLLFYLLNE